MTRVSSMLILASALAFVSTALPGASASVLPRQEGSTPILQAQHTPNDEARVVRDVLDEQQVDPGYNTLTSRDENEQTAADASNDADKAQWWPCRWGWRWDSWSRRCVRDWGRPGPWYAGGRDDGFGSGGFGGGFGGPRKRDELVADDSQRQDDDGPGGGRGWGWGGHDDGWRGGHRGGWGGSHKRDELVADEAQREDDWGPGGGRGWGGGGWGGRYGGGWGGGYGGGGWGGGHRGGGGGWGGYGGGRGRGWSRRDVEDEERGPGGGGRGGGGGGRGGGGRGGGGRGGHGYDKRDEIEARDEVETRDENTANKANLLPCATGYHLDVLSLQCVPNPPGFC